MADFHFYTDTVNLVSNTLNTYVGDVSAAITGGFSGVATSLVAVYVMLRFTFDLFGAHLLEDVAEQIQHLVGVGLGRGLRALLDLLGGDGPGHAKEGGHDGGRDQGGGNGEGEGQARPQGPLAKAQRSKSL